MLGEHAKNDKVPSGGKPKPSGSKPKDKVLSGGMKLFGDKHKHKDTRKNPLAPPSRIRRKATIRRR
jgi:hypothetical protein